MKRRGFTLIEVLVTVGITGVLVGSLGLFVREIAQARVDIRTRSERESSVTTVFDAIDDAIATSIASGSDGGAGFSGDQLSVRIAFDSTTIQRAFDQAPERVLLPGDSLEVAFRPGAGRLALARDGDALSDLPTTVFAMRLRYFDGSRWQESWDSIANDGLPHAVECSVWFKPWPLEEKPEWFPDEELEGDIEGEFGDVAEGRLEPLGEDELLAEFGDGAAIDMDEDLPEPDRRRVFAVPDADQPDESVFFEETPFTTDDESFDVPEDPDGPMEDIDA